MRRVLKDEGKIIISVYSNEALKERLALYKKLNFKIKRIETNKGIVTCIFDDFNTEGISEQFSEKQLKELGIKLGK